MKLLSKYFSVTFTIQFILFIAFFMINIQNLDNIQFTITFLDQDYEVSLNIYSLMAIVVVVTGILLLVSVNVFGLGISDSGSKTLGVYFVLFLLFALFTASSTYFFGPMGTIGSVINIFLILGYLLRLIDYMLEPDQQMED